MRQTPHSRSLESFRIFPYLAWGLIALFAFFVYTITQNLRTVTAELEQQSEFTEVLVKTAPSKRTDFEGPQTSN